MVVPVDYRDATTDRRQQRDRQAKVGGAWLSVVLGVASPALILAVEYLDFGDRVPVFALAGFACAVLFSLFGAILALASFSNSRLVGMVPWPVFVALATNAIAAPAVATWFALALLGIIKS